MDVLSIKNKIKELKILANKTDSKRKDLEYRMQIKELERQLEKYTDDLISNFPEKVKLHIKVDKIIEYDTSEFLDFIVNYIQDTGEYDINMEEEFNDYINDNLCIDYHVDLDDYDIQMEKEC